MTIYDYYVEKLGPPPNDDTLRELPVDSVCGADCKAVIDAAAAFLACAVQAYGDYAEPDYAEVFQNIMVATFDIVEVFWRG